MFEKPASNSKSSSLESIVVDSNESVPNLISIDRIRRSLSILNFGKERSTELDGVLIVFNKLLDIAEEEIDTSSELIQKLKILALCYIDLIKADRMVAYDEVTSNLELKQRYGREEEDDFRTGPKTFLNNHDLIFNQDDLYAWYNGLENNEIDTLLGSSGFVMRVSDKGDKNTAEESDELMDQLVSSLEVFQADRAGRYYQRKSKALINSGNYDIERFTERHKDHYKKFFANTEGVEPLEVILTNSGNRSNESVINAVSNLGYSKAFIQEGWYYENLFSLREKFTDASIDQADVFIINVDASGPVDTDHYRTEFDKSIKHILGRVKNEPEKKFILIIDATCNLLSLQELHIPENLSVVKTFSATKHQRGGKKYFYGGVAVFGDDNLVAKIKEEVTNSGSGVSGLSALHYPRLRKTEIEKNIEHVAKLNELFKDQLSLAQATIPEALRIKPDNYHYYTYLELPSFIFGDSIDYDPYIQLFKSDTQSQFKYETGDSFGLDATRLTAIGGCGFNCLRFSFGLETYAEDVKSLAEYIGSNWTNQRKLNGLVPDRFFINTDNLIEQKESLEQLFEKKLKECGSLMDSFRRDPSDNSAKMLIEILHYNQGSLIKELNEFVCRSISSRFASTILTKVIRDRLEEVYAYMYENGVKIDYFYYTIANFKKIADQLLAIYDSAIEKRDVPATFTSEA